MRGKLHSARYEEMRTLLRRYRSERKLSQVDVANRLGRPQSYVSKYESGERRIDVIELIDISYAIGFPVDELVRALSRKISRLPATK